MAKTRVYSPPRTARLMSGSSADVLFELLICHLVILSFVFPLGFLKPTSLHIMKRNSSCLSQISLLRPHPAPDHQKSTLI